jgi:hypothetical protein
MASQDRDVERADVPLSEDEQRILHEIEQQFYESDPAFAREVGKTSLYRHAGRNLKWAALGFVLGFGLLIASFAYSLVLGFAGFLVMLGCAFVFERNLRKMGKAGWREMTGKGRAANKATNVRNTLGDAGKRLRKKFRKEE